MPPAQKYDLDAEIARTVELTRKAAEAAEAAAAAYRRRMSPQPVASERRFYARFTRNTGSGADFWHLGPYLTEDAARREALLVHGGDLFFQTVEGCWVGYQPQTPHLDTLVPKTGDE